MDEDSIGCFRGTETAFAAASDLIEDVFFFKRVSGLLKTVAGFVDLDSFWDTAWVGAFLSAITCCATFFFAISLAALSGFLGVVALDGIESNNCLWVVVFVVFRFIFFSVSLATLSVLCEASAGIVAEEGLELCDCSVVVVFWVSCFILFSFLGVIPSGSGGITVGLVVEDCFDATCSFGAVAIGLISFLSFVLTVEILSVFSKETSSLFLDVSLDALVGTGSIFSGFGVAPAGVCDFTGWEGAVSAILLTTDSGLTSAPGAAVFGSGKDFADASSWSGTGSSMDSSRGGIISVSLSPLLNTPDR